MEEIPVKYRSIEQIARLSKSLTKHLNKPAAVTNQMPTLGGKLIMVAILAAVDFQIYGIIIVDMNEGYVSFGHLQFSFLAKSCARI